MQMFMTEKTQSIQLIRDYISFKNTRSHHCKLPFSKDGAEKRRLFKPLRMAYYRLVFLFRLKLIGIFVYRRQASVRASSKNILRKMRVLRKWEAQKSKIERTFKRSKKRSKKVSRKSHHMRSENGENSSSKYEKISNFHEKNGSLNDFFEESEGDFDGSSSNSRSNSGSYSEENEESSTGNHHHHRNRHKSNTKKSKNGKNGINSDGEECLTSSHSSSYFDQDDDVGHIHENHHNHENHTHRISQSASKSTTKTGKIGDFRRAKLKKAKFLLKDI